MTEFWSSAVLLVIGGVFSSSVLTLILSKYLEFRAARKQKPLAMAEAMQWLMRERLENIMLKSLTRAQEDKNFKVYLSQKRFVELGLDYYHSLGGDGQMKSLKAEYDELEIDYKK